MRQIALTSGVTVFPQEVFPIAPLRRDSYFPVIREFLQYSTFFLRPPPLPCLIPILSPEQTGGVGGTGKWGGRERKKEESTTRNTI